MEQVQSAIVCRPLQQRLVALSYLPMTVSTVLLAACTCRYTRAAVKAVADGASADAPLEALLVVMGEKGRSQLQRDMRSSIYATVAGGQGCLLLLRCCPLLHS